ncbi:hypothetical protein M0802_016492 [Mischocyttarus mexicanus]|nr:hypothetical protein M0802_016492 [Mischocyttarus mexicanus]
MLRLDYVKTNPEKLERNVKVKSKQSDRQVGQRSKHLLVQCSQGYLINKTQVIQDKPTTVKTLTGCVTVFSAKVKVKPQPSDRQEGKGSKKLLVQFTQV